MQKEQNQNLNNYLYRYL